MLKIRLLSVLLAATALTSTALSGPIRVTITVPDGTVVDGGEWMSGEEIEVDLGDSPLSGVRTIHIWEEVADSQTGPWTSTIGPVTIVGTFLPDSSAQINILIASIDSSFPVLPTEQPAGAGALALGTDPLVPAITFTDPELQRRSVLVVNVREAIRGDITVGQIPFLQASNLTATTAIGDIDSNITAIAPNRALGFSGFSAFPPTPFNSIGTIRAGRSIRGSIRVDHPATVDGTLVTGLDGNITDTNQDRAGTINSVTVGPRSGEASGVVGMLADISTNWGRIGVVQSTGTIGTEENLVDISAGSQIWQVRTTDESGAVLPTSIFANITAGTRYQPNNSDVSLSNSTGAIFLVESGKDFKGSVTAKYWSTRRTGNGDGLRVKGDVDAPINIALNVRQVDLVARSFLQPIVVGSQLKGSIVAYGNNVPSNFVGCSDLPFDADSSPSGGFIKSISIGNGNPNTFPLNWNANLGFVAGSNGPYDIRPYRLDQVPPNPGSNVFESAFDVWTRTGTPLDGNSRDVVIYAQHIETVDIRSLDHATTSPFDFKNFMPRIEARRIDSLTIGEMRAGVIWSGALNWTGCGGTSPILLNDDRADNYASIGELSIGCVSPAADVWFKDTPFAEIRGDLLGELHLPALESFQTIRIGGKLGRGIDTVDGVDTLGDPGCGSLSNFPFWRATAPADIDSIGNPVYEDSPRGSTKRDFADGTTSSPVLANRSEIRIAPPGILAGQIIIDAANTGSQRAETHWKGLVRRNTDVTGVENDLFLATEQPEPFNAPRYHALPADLGGGAVGLVPFTVHDRATWPPNPGPGQQPPQVLLEPVINDPDGPLPGERRTIDIEFYGPVRATGTDDPVLIYKAPLTDPTVFTSQPVNAMFQIAVRRTGISDDSSRLLVISRAPGQMIPKGVYKVVPIRDTSAASFLYCDGLESLTPVADFVYLFAVGGDCNSNGVADAYDIANGTSVDIDPADTIPDDCDPPISGTCAWRFESGDTPSCEAADYDNNGGVDGSDLASFFVDFEAGETCADVDQNGGIDGGDIGAFFAVFESGGC